MTSTPVTAPPTMSTFTPTVAAPAPRLTRRTAAWLLAGAAVVLVLAAAGVGYRAQEASSTPTTGQVATSLSDQSTSAHGTLGGVRSGTDQPVGAGGATTAATPLTESSSDAALLVHGGPGSLTGASGHRLPVDR
jgi:hypothetical protein